MNKYLAFEDVLILPKFSDVVSRKDVSLSQTFLGMKLDSPIISSNMDTISGPLMCATMIKSGAMGCLHRFCTIEENVQMFYDTVDLVANGGSSFNKPMVSVGVGDNEYKRAMALFDAGATHFVIDVAHGAASHVVTMYDRLRSRLSDSCYIIVGNFATAESIIEFNKRIKNRRLPDAYKIGIGGGCFAADTRVLMSNGSYKNIQDIIPGDVVICKTGKPTKVLSFINSGKKEVIKYKNNNFYKDSLVTSDHRHWIGDYSSVKDINDHSLVKTLDKLTKKDESKYKWKELDNIEKSVMLLPRNIQFDLPKEFYINFKDYSIRDKSFISMNYNEIIKPNYELGYLFGTFLGDGNASYTEQEHTTTGSVHWSYGLKEKDIAEKTKLYLKTVFNINATITIEKDNHFSVNAYCLPLSRFFKEFNKKENKKLDWKYIIDNKDYLSGIYDGLLDSDGHYGADQRNSLQNNSNNIIELFGFLNYYLKGYYPSMITKNPTIGGLKNCNINNCKESYVARTLKSPENYLTNDYQIVRFKKENEFIDEIETYDIEVEDESHSFIANNVIVHNSLCTTRVVTGCGLPTYGSLSDCKLLGFNLISDGGIRNSSDIAKSLAAGASMVMLGGMLSGTYETPGDIVNENGLDSNINSELWIQSDISKKYWGDYRKKYRGSASISSYDTQSKQSSHRTPEGEETLVPYKGSVVNVLQSIDAGLRSAFSYVGAKDLTKFKESATLVEITSNGAAESRAHGKN